MANFEKKNTNYEYNEDLEKLMKSPIDYIRAAVAERGYNLDELVNDESSLVRMNEVKQGYTSILDLFEEHKEKKDD